MSADTETKAVATPAEQAEKRKEPEAETKAPAAEAEKVEPEAKKAKVDAPADGPGKPIDPAVIRKQVEYYLSDENLKGDRFFHTKISENKEGWLEMQLVLSCNKMKAMHATKEDVVVALKESKIELNADNTAIRRPAGAALPKLEAKHPHNNNNNQKKNIHAHDGGVIMVFKNIPAEQSWVQVKENLAKLLPEKKNIWFCSEVNDQGVCKVVAQPFEGDMKFFEALEFDLGGVKMKPEICQGEAVQQILKILPKHVRDKRDKELKKKQKERQRPIMLNGQKFVNIGSLRGKVKEILNSRSDGEALKADSADYKLIEAVIKYHPTAGKADGCIGLKVDKSSHGDNRCFHLIKEGGVTDDVSMKKCIEAIELNPPYAEAAAKETSPKAAEKKEEKTPEAAEKKEEQTPEKKEEPAAEKKDEPMEEKKEATEEKKEEPAAATA